MASTILYKFRSGTTFEALPLPGSAARVFDVKKAIVKAKKLDSGGSMEFDLSVRNADTNEEYANESMLLPRGTRLIVQRLPAARGHGFLSRMARNEHAGAGPPGNAQHQPVAPGSAPSGFYTIESRAGDDDEFVQSGPGDEEKELAALQAVTNMQTGGPAMAGGYAGPPGGGPPRGGAGGPGGRQGGPPKQHFNRPNADPELRDQEKQLMPKKRATGIPRTFLNLSAPPQTDGNKEGENESIVPLLQPNTLGFQELLNRGGGQSANTLGTRRDLDYALKLTATTIPEHLQCGICNGVVKNAMLLPWDPEGRTACETCIRDALTQNGFRCPLTGMDGVSPDDLHPNVGLRKAAELFIKGVIEKIDEIEKNQVEEAEMTVDTSKSADANILDGDGVEKGVIVSKKMTMASRKKEDDDPFGGGDDEFGGDVFAVETEKPNEEEAQDEKEKEEDPKKANGTKEPRAETKATKEADSNNQDKNVVHEESKNITEQSDNRNGKVLPVSTDARKGEGDGAAKPVKQRDAPTHHRDRRRRGPPAGYTMGPAGGAAGAAQARQSHDDDQGDRGFQGGRDRNLSPSGSGRGGGFHGNQDRNSFRGRGGRGRGRFGGGRGDYDRSGGGDYHQSRSEGGDDVSIVSICSFCL
jgi:hypothetical protein